MGMSSYYLNPTNSQPLLQHQVSQSAYKHFIMEQNNSRLKHFDFIETLHFH